MMASLAVAPPAPDLGSSPAAFADPAPDGSSTGSPDAAIPQTGEPIAGPVPLPHQRPRLSIVLMTAEVPLPRSRPNNDASQPEVVPEFSPNTRTAE
jgi:hypothetical protein